MPTIYLWATALGGVGVGAGMAIGGYCPGTSVVGFMSGKIDGLVFFLGIVIGTWVFAGAYDKLLPMLETAPGPDGQTLSQLMHVPDLVVLLGLTTVAAVVGWFTARTPAASCPIPGESQ